jgi:Rhodopirellula transposase DDE domain
MTHDTAEFAVESIRRWWRQMGQGVYRHARQWLITADCGGSNGSRARLWEVQLQRLADELGLQISVCHFPPGTSKWTKIEHRMFCHITQNWRERPLVSHEAIIELIGATTTQGGLKIQRRWMNSLMPKGSKSATPIGRGSSSRQTKSTANGTTVFIPRRTHNCSSYYLLV